MQRSIEHGGDRPDAVISEPLLTCAGCNRTLRGNTEGFLPAHDRPSLVESENEVTIQCAGSYTLGYPARLEIRPLLIKAIEDSISTQPAEAIADCARFLNDWLGDRGMPIDNHTMVRMLAHANNAGHAALRLLNYGNGTRSGVASITRNSVRKAIAANRGRSRTAQ